MSDSLSPTGVEENLNPTPTKGGAGAKKNTLATILAALAGLLLSALVVAGLAYALAQLASANRVAEMRALHATLPPYRETQLVHGYENWDNLLIYWQSESVLPRIVDEFRSEHPVGAVVTHYEEQLTAAGWEEYREPWSLYPAYRRGSYRIAILFQQPYAQDWLPAGDYHVHLWSLPLLEELLGRDLAAGER
jgi:hypothetical protein